MKVTITFAVCLLTMQIARSQVKFGLKAGVNLSTQAISGMNVTSTAESKTDFNAGVLANVNISETFIFQPELVYSGQGSGTTNSSGKLDYNYLNVPVLLKFQHPTGFFIETGPQLGILLSAKFKTNNSTVDEKAYVKSTDLAWVFGGGYKIPDLNLGLDFRYNLGLTNIQDGSIVTVKNQVIQIGVFYIF